MKVGLSHSEYTRSHTLSQCLTQGDMLCPLATQSNPVVLVRERGLEWPLEGVKYSKQSLYLPMALQAANP